MLLMFPLLLQMVTDFVKTSWGASFRDGGWLSPLISLHSDGTNRQCSTQVIIPPATEVVLLPSLKLVLFKLTSEAWLLRFSK